MKWWNYGVEEENDESSVKVSSGMVRNYVVGGSWNAEKLVRSLC